MILFVLAVLAVIASIDLLLAATMGYLARDPGTGAIDWTLAADPQLLAFAVVGTLIVVGGGSLFKVAQLRGGDRVVAEELGGRRLNPDTPVPSEQQLLNVVEEMAIASGTPVPPVYLLDHEEGSTPFAAGFAPSDAVIGVTRGAAEQLTRDELQGVMAHEFSRILNGDMRLNIRLIGLLSRDPDRRHPWLLHPSDDGLFGIPSPALQTGGQSAPQGDGHVRSKTVGTS